ncbi:hypothetical protein RMN57_13125 [Kitasatospora sp. CM 4170]|uniref:Uncharacterized protein n=1 Tax=Kitasatospora aburaviensis TaxID=67265 RepID=A0ABW1F300_9ACTN|nr:hypothetical protein [Kitasatospora sp. CM 4170]WNM45596.1 hypothetical protein RMN57_13125 [Kitasatospora sp. CM 4170]
MTAVLWWAIPAALAFAGLYRAVDHPIRQTLRLAGIAALWAALITAALPLLLRS